MSMFGTLFCYDVKEDNAGDNLPYLIREGENVICPYTVSTGKPLRCGAWCALFDVAVIGSDTMMEASIKICHGDYKFIEWNGSKEDMPTRVQAIRSDYDAAKRARSCQSSKESEESSKETS